MEFAEHPWPFQVSPDWHQTVFFQSKSLELLMPPSGTYLHASNSAAKGGMPACRSMMKPALSMWL